MKIFLCAIIGASFILGACSSSDSNDAPPATTEVEIPIETPEEEVTETPVVVEPTPTAEIVIPTPAPLIHTVQPGNSLSQIAQSYGVPIELLAAENLIEDFYMTRKSKRGLPSAYSYECKDCTISRILNNRKGKGALSDWQYPDW